MPETTPASSLFPRVVTSGKWLRAGAEKWPMRGVCYGPFKPNSRGESFPENDRLTADMDHIRQLGFNTVRLYELPTEFVIQTARERGLRLLIGIPWTDHVDFLRDRTLRREIKQRITKAVIHFRDEPCVAGFLVGNEIEKTLVRWMGPTRVRNFLEDLIETGRDLAPKDLFSYATYPSTEYLIPRNADFLAVNLYLEQPAALSAYLQRLQNIAGNKPLVITEFGLDVAAHGEYAQAETRRWFHEICHRAAAAGTVWFSYTDEWFRGGEAVTQWKFGLVDEERKERTACRETAPRWSVAATRPRISVIVCTYNGAATLRACLESLGKQTYSNYEVLLIDDGSSQDIRPIYQDIPQVRYVRQDHAGLSVARNLGASLATGEILAYTDDDCMADEDWLTYLSLGFDDPGWVAVGGPNIPPLPRNRTEAVVAAAPGAPAHVLLTDTEAEHLPGCNLAIRKTALEAIGGFRPHYLVAGDDVDICWRLREAGGKLRFVSGAMVWHHRRYTMGAYFRQQRGYGRAESLLMKDHPQRFGPFGGARWFGGIYGDRINALVLSEGSIFHGPMGKALFQGIYLQGHRCWLDWLGGVLWVALALVALMVQMPLISAIILCFSLALAGCRLLTQTQTPFALNLRESLLLLGLCWIQPILREWERLVGMVTLGVRPGKSPRFQRSLTPAKPRKITFPLGELHFWSETGIGREALLHALKAQLQDLHHLAIREDDGWRNFDLEVEPQKAVSSAFVSVTEYHVARHCLTRVRILIRVRYSVLLGYCFLLLLLLGSMFMSSPLLRLGSFGLLIMGVQIPWVVYFFKTRSRKQILAAAAQAGL